VAEPKKKDKAMSQKTFESGEMGRSMVDEMKRGEMKREERE
jgi:hypothetical protein